MSNRHPTIAGALICALLFTGTPAVAQSGVDPVLELDARSKVELDLAAMVADLEPLLLETLAAEGEENAELGRFLIELLGVEALDRLRMETRQRKDHAAGKLTIELNRDVTDGLIPRTFAIPAGTCRFDSYLDRDELAMLAVVHDLRAHLELLLDALARPDVAEMVPWLPVDENGELSVAGFTPRTDLLPLLSGEFDVVMLDGADGASATGPLQLPVMVVIGSTDGRVLRDRLAATIELFTGGGVSVTGMLAAMPVDTVGAFEVMTAPFGGAIAASTDFLIVAGAVGSLPEMLAEPDGDLEVPDGLSWRYLNGRKYGAIMDDLMAAGSALAPAEAGESAWTARLYDVLFSHLHSQTERVTSRPGRLEVESEMDGPMLTGVYRMARTALAEMPAIIAKEKEAQAREEEIAKYRAIVAELDAAFTAYGDDHDGRFPADPAELVAEGYLEEFPLDEEVPPGTYVEGAYTHLPLRDDAGEVAGYFLFVYGGGEHAGYDVFTPENVREPEEFKVQSDGRPDGVAAFCYDGLAIAQMERWRGE